MDKQIDSSIIHKEKHPLHFSSNSNHHPIVPQTRLFSTGNLSLDDWSIISHIEHAYDIWTLESDTNHMKNSSSSDNGSLTDFLNDEEQIYQGLIQFYKEIPQFQKINVEDQILLIKCNLTHLVHIHHVLKDQFLENPQIGLHMSEWISPDFHYQMSKTRHSYNYFVEHPIVLKISLVPLMFIINLSRFPLEQFPLEIIEKPLLIEHQNFFVTILWKYLNVIYNEKDALYAIELIVFQFLRYQLLMDQMENFIEKKINTEQFHPLTKSVLRLN